MAACAGVALLQAARRAVYKEQRGAVTCMDLPADLGRLLRGLCPLRPLRSTRKARLRGHHAEAGRDAEDEAVKVGQLLGGDDGILARHLKGNRPTQVHFKSTNYLPVH